MEKYHHIAHLLVSQQQQKQKLIVHVNLLSVCFKSSFNFCGLSQETKLSIHCEVLRCIAAERRRPGEGDNSHGAVQGKPDEAHISESYAYTSYVDVVHRYHPQNYNPMGERHR